MSQIPNLYFDSANTAKKGPIPHCFTEFNETILLLIELEPETACFSVITRNNWGVKRKFS